MEFTIKNRRNRTSLKNFERDLIESGLLRLRSISKKNLQETKVEDFILAFFRTYNRTYNTVYVKNGITQTAIGRRRSTGDIFRLCKYYFPDCTFIEVLKIMDRLPQKPNIISSICYGIFRRVYRYDTWAINGTIYDTTVKDEFGRIPGEYLNL